MQARPLFTTVIRRLRKDKCLPQPGDHMMSPEPENMYVLAVSALNLTILALLGQGISPSD